MGYQCSTCGQWHDQRPTSFAFPLPDAIAALGNEERLARAELGTEQCILDDEHFFILGNLDLRGRGTDEVIRWSVWSTLSRKNFERSADLWRADGRESEPPYLGWLNNAIPGIDATVNLPVLVHTNPVGERPRLEVVADSHPLRAWQLDGIRQDQADHFVHAAMFGVAG